MIRQTIDDILMTKTMHSETGSLSDTGLPPLRLAVIGGGVTGLAAAFRLQELAKATGRSVHVTVLEASDRLGGVFGTEVIGDYLVERGADSFITSKPAGVNLCRRLGLEDRLIPTNARYRNSLILSGGRPVPTPEGFNLVAPGKLWPLLKSPLLSWRGKLRVLAESRIPPRSDSGDESVADFVRRRLGQESLERIVQPLVGGIYTSDPERLSAQTTLSRFLVMEQKFGSLYRGLRAPSAGAGDHGSTSGARYGLFATFPGGMQELLDALERRVRETGEIWISSPVKGLRKTESSWEIETGSGVGSYDGVVLAVSARAAVKLLQPVDPNCAQQISQIECASSAIVLTGHALSDIEHPLETFGLVIPHREGRRILATSMLSRKFDQRAPEGRVCLRTFVGGAMQPQEYAQSDDEIILTVLSELRSLLGVHGVPDFAVVARYPQAMPQFTVGHLTRVQGIRQAAEGLGTLALAGNYFEGVGVPDCIQSGERAAEQVMQKFGLPQQSLKNA